jgi:uncharacterized protein YwqG
MTSTSTTDKKPEGGPMATVSGFFKKSLGKFFTQGKTSHENEAPDPIGRIVTTYTFDFLRTSLTSLTKEDHRKRLKENQLETLWPQLEKLARNEIKFQLAEVLRDTLKIGQSRVGGLPDLPPDIPWATDRKGSPLSFIAQINCRELKPYDLDNLLPDAGLLYFFYDAEQEAIGVDPKDREKFKVVFYDGPFRNLGPATFPEDLPDYGQFDECAITFKSSLSLPDAPENWGVSLSQAETQKYIQLQNQYQESLYHKMLGYANPLQNSMELDCQLVTNGIFIGNTSGFRGRRRTELEKTMGEWRLLLQLHSDDFPGMIWGEEGRLYFWIKAMDLKNRNFKNCWALQQAKGTQSRK